MVFMILFNHKHREGSVTDMKHFETISQVTYLTTENFRQYRTIMRIFYEEYEKMRFQLYKEDVMEQLVRLPGFEVYSIEQLKSDLDSLVNWKNLIPIQDPRKVYSIAEYKNKQFRYSMSEYAVEIERLTIKLEGLLLESGSLSPHYFVRILSGLNQISPMMTAPLKEVNQWWRALQDDFRILNQNYQDYLREFYSGKSEKLLKSVEFLLYKDRFLAYLREFIRELQNYSAKIQQCLMNISPENRSEILARVIDSELEIPRPMSEQTGELENQIRAGVHGKWESLERWFMGDERQLSDCSQVLDITNEIIRKMIQNAAMILQMQSWGMSRKEDYKKFLALFLDCGEMEDAHSLASLVFGAFHSEHFIVNIHRTTDSINSSVYEEAAAEFELKPRTNKYRPRSDKIGFEIHTFEKMLQKQEYLERVKREKELVLKYRKGKRLEMNAIDDIIEASVRSTLIRWIAAANTTSDSTGNTEFGEKYRLLREPGDCILYCEDGDLRMPNYVLEFEEEV